MPELYKVLDPKDVPALVVKRKGPPKKAFRLAMEQMQVGDTIAIPITQRTRVSLIGQQTKRIFRSALIDGVCYVRRLPDDAS